MHPSSKDALYGDASTLLFSVIERFFVIFEFEFKYIIVLNVESFSFIRGSVGGFRFGVEHHLRGKCFLESICGQYNLSES